MSVICTDFIIFIIFIIKFASNNIYLVKCFIVIPYLNLYIQHIYSNP